MKKRLDVLLVERGLAESRAQAQALVMAGRVPGHSKPGEQVAEDAPLEVTAPPPYVSRAGHKLANALDAFGIDVTGLDCLDVGASTGGFTDVLLQRGAARVIALDVGYGQLHSKIRDDPRVTVLERVNARSLTELPFAPQLVTCDVSFISVKLALPPALAPRGARLAARSSSSSRSSRQVAPRHRRASSARRRCSARVVREVAEALARVRGRAARGRRLGLARPEGKP